MINVNDYNNLNISFFNPIKNFNFHSSDYEIITKEVMKNEKALDYIKENEQLISEMQEVVDIDEHPRNEKFNNFFDRLEEIYRYKSHYYISTTTTKLNRDLFIRTFFNVVFLSHSDSQFYIVYAVNRGDLLNLLSNLYTLRTIYNRDSNSEIEKKNISKFNTRQLVFDDEGNVYLDNYELLGDSRDYVNNSVKLTYKFSEYQYDDFHKQMTGESKIKDMNQYTLITSNYFQNKFAQLSAYANDDKEEIEKINHSRVDVRLNKISLNIPTNTAMWLRFYMMGVMNDFVKPGEIKISFGELVNLLEDILYNKTYLQINYKNRILRDYE